MCYTRRITGPFLATGGVSIFVELWVIQQEGRLCVAPGAACNSEWPTEVLSVLKLKERQFKPRILTEALYRLRGLVSSYQLNAHLLYSTTMYMLHYNPQHVSSSTLLIFRKTNCVITASGIVTAVQYAGWERTAVRSQPAYCTAIYREWRYQRL